jgi:hypothetical protein
VTNEQKELVAFFRERWQHELAEFLPVAVARTVCLAATGGVDEYDVLGSPAVVAAEGADEEPEESTG